MRLQNPVVMVIGATDRSLGQTAAQYSREQEAHVVTTDRHPCQSNALAQPVRFVDGSEAYGVVGEITWHAQVEELVQQTVGTFNRINVFVSNVDPHMLATAAKLSDDQRDRLIDVYLQLT
ncbi:MAG: SDR family NAD(P)-dependent oxidoreductase [Candidatus Tectomicrobia bacterium]|nr:SDR family NAD(P)-dependent oxidoreductase [Candidatus Tectomicrobia bacterium]